VDDEGGQEWEAGRKLLATTTTTSTAGTTSFYTMVRSRFGSFLPSFLQASLVS
jgi:hypothetical protein